ncbi:MAG: M24 family metallopeptidase [Faecalibacterium sp.]
MKDTLSMLHRQRFARVSENLSRLGLTQMVVSDPPTIFYLTGVRIQPGERMLALLLRADGAHRLFVNALFGVPEAGLPVELFSDGEDAPARLLPWLERDKPLGIDKNWPARFLLRLMELDAAPSYRNASAACDDARAIKDKAEQDALRESSRVNDECMAEFSALIRPGITERQMAEQIKAIYAAHGCTDVSFEPICGFGAHAADPHHANDDTPLVPGQCVLIDVGGVYQDYCSDMTRTFFTAEPTEEEHRVYELVRQAQAAAEELVRPGVRLCQIDAAARNIIEQAGYGPYFNHRLGHFIGLEDHEAGDVSAVNERLVEPGMCFSIEPGIYLPGRFGVRIEDLVLVTETGCEVLNRYPHELCVKKL